MSTQVSHATYYSLHPKDTCIGEMVQESCCFGKIVLGIVAVIALPLELLGRLFANLAIAVHRPFRTETQQPPIKATPTVPTNSEPVEKIKEQNLPIETTPTKPLTQDICVLKARGTLYGQALGDSLGLPSEFSPKAVLLKYKPQELEFSDLPNIAPLRNLCSKFAERGWTDDTDQMIAIARAEYEASLDSSLSKEERMAKHLDNWFHYGLNNFSTIQGHSFISRADPESSDLLRKTTSCQDIGAMTRKVVQHSAFLSHPYNAALTIWENDKPDILRRPAANGAIMRTSVLGSIYRNDLNKAKEAAIRYAKVTHADPRSIASAVALTIAIALLHNGASLDNAMKQAEDTAVQVLYTELELLQLHMSQQEGAKWKKFAQKFDRDLRQCMHDDLATLKLGEGLIGYTFKCLGAAFYAVREAQRLINEGTTPEGAFRTALETIIFEGGDADTNAAAAGALLGAYLGEEAIPASWKKDLHPQDKRVLEETLEHVEILAKNPSS